MNLIRKKQIEGLENDILSSKVGADIFTRNTFFSLGSPGLGEAHLDGDIADQITTLHINSSDDIGNRYSMLKEFVQYDSLIIKTQSGNISKYLINSIEAVVDANNEGHFILTLQHSFGYNGTFEQSSLNYYFRKSATVDLIENEKVRAIAAENQIRALVTALSGSSGTGNSNTNFSTTSQTNHINNIGGTLTVDTGLSYVGGEYISIAAFVDLTNIQTAIVTDYTGDQLTFTHVSNNGTYDGDPWVINLSSAPGESTSFSATSTTLHSNNEDGSLTVGDGLSYVGGEYISISYPEDTTAVQIAIVTDYSGGVLTFTNVSNNSNMLNHNNWIINLSSAPGTEGPIGSSGLLAMSMFENDTAADFLAYDVHYFQNTPADNFRCISWDFGAKGMKDARATFTVPSSGNVRVVFSGYIKDTGGSSECWMGLHDDEFSTTSPTYGWFQITKEAEAFSYDLENVEWILRDLTPGEEVTVYFHAITTASSSMQFLIGDQRTSPWGNDDIPKPTTIRVYNIDTTINYNP